MIGRRGGPIALLVSFSILCVSTAAAQTKPATTITVHGYKFVGSRNDLVRPCGTDPNIRGCTRFFGRKLTGDCSLAADGWMIAASVEYGMLTYVWDRKIIGHEFAHIAEIRYAVEDYVRDVRALRFDDLSECEILQQEAARTFPAVMDLVQWGSNTNRHPLMALERPAPSLVSPLTQLQNVIALYGRDTRLQSRIGVAD